MHAEFSHAIVSYTATKLSRGGRFQLERGLEKRAGECVFRMLQLFVKVSDREL